MFLVHGQVKKVVTDRGSAFTRTLTQQIFHLFGVKHITCTAGHHASNGMADRADKTSSDSKFAMRRRAVLQGDDKIENLDEYAGSIRLWFEKTREIPS